MEQGHKVQVLAVNSKKYAINPENVPEAYRNKTNIEWIDVDLSVKPLPAFFNLFSNKSYHVSRFVSNNFRKRLKQVLKENQFDVVQLETLFMTPYIELIRKHSDAKIILRAHNIEHLIWQRIYRLSKNAVRKFYLKHLYKTLRNYELNILSKTDAVLPISEKDARFFEKYTNVPVQTIPFGKKLPELQQPKENTENALYYIGAMNWMPNAEGIKWFINQVWPTLLDKHPDIRLYLAGREMPLWLRKLEEKNIEVVGEVEDAETFIQNKSICIAPLFSGSGIRIKIIESMSLGKAVVSTSIGAEGIDVENGVHISLADNAKEFAEAVSFLYTHPDKATVMGQKARNLIGEQHNHTQIIETLLDFYRQIL